MQFSHHALLLRICLISLAIAAVSGCGTVSVATVVGAAVNAALETSGLKKPASGETSVTLRIDSGPALNSTADGEPLALLVRLYQLRSDTGFSSLSYDQLLDRAPEKQLLGEDVLSVRELTVLPGKHYDITETLSKEAKVLGIVALFHSPASTRWKYTFDAPASSEGGIELAFHACAMTVGAGILTNPAASESARSLAGTRCGI